MGQIGFFAIYHYKTESGLLIDLIFQSYLKQFCSIVKPIVDLLRKPKRYRFYFYKNLLRAVMKRFLCANSLCLKLIILFLSVFILPCQAQTCNGVLGEPVFKVDFGAGTDRGTPLPLTETDYIYTSTYALLYKQYSIVNNTAGFYSQWFSVNDHTGNTNGYMMIFNCAAVGDILYTNKISGLCPNTTFELSSWLLSLLNKDLLKGIDANVTLSVETSSGTVLNTYNSGDIPTTNTPEWRNFKLYFTTPVQQTDIVIKIINNAPGGDGNDLALDDITLRPCQPDLNASFSAQNSAQTLTLCQGDDAVYQLGTNIVAAYQNPAYQWQVNASDGSGWKDLAGANSTSIQLNFKTDQPGLYQYRLYSVQEKNKDLACCQVFSDTASVQINSKPVPAVAANTPLCVGSALNLSVAKAALYQWSGPAGFTSSAQNPVIKNVNAAQAGWYYVMLTSAAGCVATDSVQVTLNPETGFDAGANVTICQGSSTVLNASGGASYRWYPAAGLSDNTIANPVANPLITTVFRVEITNQYGCVNTDSVTITIAKPPVAIAGPDKKVTAGKSVRLSGKILGDHYTYYWLPATNLANINTLEPLASPTENTTYTLHAVSALGCGETVDSVNVKVYQELVVPNTFSPNADGVNDTWNITALEAFPASITEVYNRYGQQVFRNMSNNNPWDGTYNGQPLPVGTYFYKISNENKILKSGWVLIVR